MSTKIDLGSKITRYCISWIHMSTYTTGQTWGALRKAWKAYKIAKVQHDSAKMKEYSERIRTLQTQLGVPQSTFQF